VGRRPTAIDGFARSIARRWVEERANSAGMEEVQGLGLEFKA